MFDVELAIRKLKNNKSSGSSFITGELVKQLGRNESVIEFLAFVFNHVCKTGLPVSWN